MQVKQYSQKIFSYLGVLLFFCVLGNAPALFSESKAKQKLAQQKNQRGVRLYQLNRYAAALNAFREASEKDPKNAEYPNNAGMCYLQLSRYREAAVLFQKASKIKQLPLYYHNLGLAYTGVGKGNAAIQAYQAAVKRKPKYFDAWSRLGLLLMRKGDLPQAEKALLKASSLKRSYDVENFLGVLYLQQGKLQQAKVKLQRSISLNDKFYMSYYNLGVVEQKRNKLLAAEKNYKKCLGLNREYLYAYYNLALVQAKIGRRESAKKSFQIFIKKAPPSMERMVLEAKKRLQSLQEGKYKEL
ncbi:MAG: tetratricopeptide repeat protein [Spirochaetota bacterium]